MKRILYAMFLFMPLSPAALAQELGDPRTRDEDISGTVLAVEVSRLPSGFFNYIYTITAPITNKGRVTTFNIDISCVDVADVVPFPEPPTSMYFIYATEDSKHAPFQMYHSPTGSTGMSLSVDNRAVFGVSMDPGESHAGFRILSPFPPVGREYELSASWSLDDYDYGSISDEEMQTVPWKHDFTVKGMTQAPGCSAEPEPPALFAGNPVEPYNNLLQYASPTQSAFHTDSRTVTFDVHYSKGLLPESFKVEPGWARKHFTPVPGTNQVVKLKLHPGVNTFRFEGWKQRGYELEPMRENRNEYPDKDNDTFTIRRSPPGHDKDETKGGDSK